MPRRFPMRCKATKLALAALAACLAVPACSQEPAAAPSLGLMGTIPIYWGEAGGIDELIGGTAEPHWARAEIEASYALQPLDYLSAEALAPLDRLLLAQPRALSGEENVALDAWVRAGGQLLLFADPMMTGHSRFPLGDRRRPMDVTLLSPILNHWGLTMEFADDEPGGPAQIDAGGLTLPVNLPGRFAEGGPCELAADRVLARCGIGRGRVTIFADAALLDLHEPDPRSPKALRGLLVLALGGNQGILETWRNPLGE
jgi:hypothetical protein